MLLGVVAFEGIISSEKSSKYYVVASCGYGVGDGQLADGAASEGLPLALGREETQLLLLVLGERGAVTHLVVMRR